MVSKEHVISLPRRVLVGNNIIENIPIYFSQLDLKPPYLIVTGEKYTKEIAEKIAENFPKDISYEVVVIRDASLDSVYYVEELVKRINAKVLLGIGGGKVIDVAKYVSFRNNLEFISIPTSPSHDGITSPFASIKGLSKAVSVKAKEPLAIIADIEILSSAPRRLINAGIGDTIGKIISVRDWKLASKIRGEYYGDYTASLSLMSAKHAFQCTRIINKDIKYGTRMLMEALISSGVAMGMAGSTRPASGSEHLFAHAVEILEPEKALHGELVGLGTIMMAYLHNINWRTIRRRLKKIGFPVKAKELGLSDEIVIKALTIAHTIRPERYTILGDRGLTWNSAEKIATITGVID
ncbi:NAD(P)-dependent glycerol-1-phosphate dehydrogenase [Sulfolobus sp. A20-N-F6]|uniref:NAD(P)-dependent glycerol-1-phosphate dehydrogenase n=1 Tax=Saccharolobus sp. A20 TaxID=1891280 RepID=UPI000845E658|nr:NAD(P)-dependent glycerol-1-phosphate dehydrogenase [Sulfolobus sp. A20]TRM77082.1 NAD(P)-dependent glycerol-1-phosphate dehydrogenase [Sulfolobus sp. B5]TRM78307.1 NAD(P)-dependent glycerol-1-phosphate dehydrogenase [Sulfolobus sp. A20-N-F8]TRM82820.1 NAD(P)-dependent glycerol-1-phosphate dehydrogenase [Sulfolobus sp. A20-N-F6]TRM84950.1 NAD(P)-dependent glycerol-1-phosphate dehydrogenase [Sulfolobus sp. F3]TRM88074.1 NAD(P)-dependent glycerol-1-phosphate dehydrogenase [Sulfolobus sp. C3]